MFSGGYFAPRPSWIAGTRRQFGNSMPTGFAVTPCPGAVQVHMVGEHIVWVQVDWQIRGRIWSGAGIDDPHVHRHRTRDHRHQNRGERGCKDGQNENSPNSGQFGDADAENCMTELFRHWPLRVSKSISLSKTRNDKHAGENGGRVGIYLRWKIQNSSDTACF